MNLRDLIEAKLALDCIRVAILNAFKAGDLAGARELLPALEAATLRAQQVTLEQQ